MNRQRAAGNGIAVISALTQDWRCGRIPPDEKTNVKALAPVWRSTRDELCCGTFWLADDFLSLDGSLTEGDIDAAMERAQDSHDANDGFNWSHLQAAIDEVKRV
jgi:hypothetical protein